MTIPRAARPPAIITISSHVARGSVGNCAVVFALQALGFPVWSVSTVSLSWHPGHGPSTRIVPPLDRFEAMLADLAGAPWIGEVGAVLSGYLGEAGQARAIARLVEAVKARNERALYLCDPIMGDNGGLYVSPDQAAEIRDRLLPLADIATPNLFELGWLAGKSLASTDDIVAAARGLGPASILVTSAPAETPDRIATLLVERDGAIAAEHRRVARPPNGLGDLASALFLGRILNGEPGPPALQKALSSVLDCLEATQAGGRDELALEAAHERLARPLSPVALRPVVPAIAEMGGHP